MPSFNIRRPPFALPACEFLSAACALAFSVTAAAAAQPHAPTPDIAVGPQYDSTHVYVAPGDLQAFVSSFLATFGGHASTRVTSDVTPTVSSTQFQYILTPVGTLSTFAYLTPVPFPFGSERTGYLVSNMDQAISAARAAGANVIVEPFKDPIGIDAIIEWPGGVKMQLYWHFTPPSYEPLRSVPENRIYVSRDRIDNFVNAFVRFSHGKVTADNWHTDAGEIGKPGQAFRRVRVESKFGKMQIMATDGQLPYPFGYDVSGYEVPDLDETLGKAKTQGATILFAPVDGDDRRTSIVKFPGGYIAEIHSALRR
jgi:predicted enzyme related to lactoylglutathione lyase